MEPGTAIFVVILSAIGTMGWVLNSWIRTKHSADLQSIKAAGSNSIGAARQIELLSSENAGLKGQVSRLEERIATLERIATDPAERIAREIDTLE